VAVWLLVCSAVAFRLTRRPRSRFEEQAPNVTWGKLESHHFSTRDGQEIGAWFVDGRGDAPSVLWVHGNGGNRSHGLRRGKLLASHYYAVLMISLRGHSDSTGDYHDVGYSTRQDIQAAVGFLEGRWPAGGRGGQFHGLGDGNLSSRRLVSVRSGAVYPHDTGLLRGYFPLWPPRHVEARAKPS